MSQIVDTIDNQLYRSKEKTCKYLKILVLVVINDWVFNCGDNNTICLSK